VASYLRAIIRGPAFRSQHNLSLADVERIRQPTLFAWGDLDVFLAPMTAAESIVAVRNHRLLRLPHAGHAPWLDEPELVGNAVVEHFSG
jgi:pimeloyl-ACP methyl ester carboxylesterase